MTKGLASYLAQKRQISGGGGVSLVARQPLAGQPNQEQIRILDPCDGIVSVSLIPISQQQLTRYGARASLQNCGEERDAPS